MHQPDSKDSMGGASPRAGREGPAGAASRSADGGKRHQDKGNAADRERSVESASAGRYRMLAIDLDGTLFDPSGRVTEANRQAVRRAQEAGMLVVLATGRGLCESRYALEALGHEGPVVLAGGALVSDPTTGRTLHRAAIEPTLAAEAVEHLRALDHAVLILLDPEPVACDYLVVNGQRLTDNTRWWLSHIGATLHQVDQPAEPDLHHALRVGIVAPAEAMPPIRESLVNRFGRRVMVQHFLAVQEESGVDMHVLEVFARGVSKWSALRWVAAEHGIDEREVAAIGDHINDVEMIRRAACGIAMGNAVEAVCEVADRRTETNERDGVAAAIDRILAGQW